MEIIELSVTKQVISRSGETALVAGETGVHAVHITYDGEWDAAASKIICFAGSGGSVAVVDNGGAVPIPWETLTKPGELDIGVIGYDAAGTMVITTRAQAPYDPRIYIYPKTTCDGELPPPGEPTPNLLAQVMAAIGEMAGLKVENKENLVAAINELLEKVNTKADKGEAGSGGGSYTLPVASADTLGGVKAKAKTDAETVEVAVDVDGKLYVPAASGGGEGYTLPVAGQELGGVKRNAMQTKDIDQMQGVFAQSLSSPVLITQDGVMMVPFVGSNIGRENGTHNFGVVSSNGAKTDEDTIPVHVDGTGKLWVKPSGEGGVTMEDVQEYVDKQLGVIENGAY